MANDGAKKRTIKNNTLLRWHLYAIFGCNAAYILYRMLLYWSSFSNWHVAGLLLIIMAYMFLFGFLRMAANSGSDLDDKGVIEYVRDLLYVTMFVQLTTGFISDWFWLFAMVPPCVGTYFAWVKVIYPWISKPDNDTMETMPQKGKQKVKYARH
eukprot:CAMPEP_0119312478 /NCGR_PEP_ID=MMETSP1333-20130426/26631_1 /TAXON_ID=418940 /ORGANISM="Scyphosphaera apsteinii, Strain RCC1455" /LENGTH=153 /DNA_ID=CAMNT_0007317107 /DNA_START=66 /DNA_END=527 /DNA_ORIENTATION=-